MKNAFTTSQQEDRWMIVKSTIKRQAASGTGSLLFIDAVTADGSSRINSLVFAFYTFRADAAKCCKTSRTLHSADEYLPKAHCGSNQGSSMQIKFFSGQVNQLISTQQIMLFRN